MATTIKELKAKINEKNEVIKNLRETNKGLIEQKVKLQKDLDQTMDVLQKLRDDTLEELATDYIGPYLKWITTQHGEERLSEKTGKPIGKMLAFTFQNDDDNKFNTRTYLDEEGRLTMVCAVSYPIEEGEDSDED